MGLMHSVLLNYWLKIAINKNGELTLSDIKRDKETGLPVESVIAIYSNELNLFPDVIGLLVKRAVFYKQVTTLDEIKKLHDELAAYCVSQFKKLHQ